MWRKWKRRSTELKSAKSWVYFPSKWFFTAHNSWSVTGGGRKKESFLNRLKTRNVVWNCLNLECLKIPVSVIDLGSCWWPTGSVQKLTLAVSICWLIKSILLEVGKGTDRTVVMWNRILGLIWNCWRSLLAWVQVDGLTKSCDTALVLTASFFALYW